MDQLSRSLQSFYSDVFEPLKLRSRSPRTKELYVTTLNNFSLFLGKMPVLADLNDDTVGAFLSWHRKRPRAPGSVNKERSNLLAIWRFACRKKLIELWPDVEADVEPARVPQAWMREDLTKLFDTLKSARGSIGGVPAPLWWKALHLILWDSGERISAAFDLKWVNVDLVRGFTLMPAETRKGRKTDRIYKISGDTVAALKDIRLPTREDVFPWPYHQTYLWTKYGNMLKKAGMPHDAKSKFHRMRKSVASYFEAGGGNATELLGHTARKVTMKYLDPRIVKEMHAIDILFRPFPD